MQKHCGRKLAKGFAEGSKVSPNNFSCRVASLRMFCSWQDCFGFHGQAYLREHARALAAMWQVQQLSIQRCYHVLLFSSSVSLSINVHQIVSGADVAERERRTWPGKVVGRSGFYEKPGFLFQRMSNCRPLC